jgi:hypothetical protein
MSNSCRGYIPPLWWGISPMSNSCRGYIPPLYETLLTLYSWFGLWW